MQILPLHHLSSLRLTTVLLLLIFATVLRSSQARTVDVSPEKSETITFIHDDDKIDMYRSHDVGKGLETDEDNEVISVRLLNSFQHLKPYAGLQKETEEEGQIVSYENILEDSTVEVTSRNTTTVTSLVETSTNVSTSTSSTVSSSFSAISSTTVTATTLEDDLIRSRLQVPGSVGVSTKQQTTSTITPVILQTKPSSKTTSTTIQPAGYTSTIKPVVITPHSTVFGTRKRTARNHPDYYQYPSIDLDQLDFDDLDYSDVDGMHLKELLATRFIPESSEQQHRDQSASNGCTCAPEKPQMESFNAEDYDDYKDYPVAASQPPPAPQAAPIMPHHGRFAARRKRLHRQQPEFSEEFLTAPTAEASSMERVERMHGALERIMGIVTIMSHVDNFIQKKTKQSIRRLARLYESSEK